MTDSPTTARTTTTSLRLSPDELVAWKAAAEAEGMTLSDWVRLRVGSATPRRRRERAGQSSPEVLAALGRVGGNVNQIARALNAGATPPSIRLLTQLAEIAAELRRIGGAAP